jgi:hypothetical protein
MRFYLCFFFSVVLLSCQKEIHMDFGEETPLRPDEIDIMAASKDFIEHEVGEDLYAFKKAPRKIRILVTDSVVVSGTGGGNCIIRPMIFMKKDSTVVTGFVDLYITDVVSYGDMIYNGISTITNNELLESAGIIDLVAVQNTDTLLLRPGKTIDVTFLTPYTRGMSVYTGIVQPTAENSIIWEPGAGQVLSDNMQILATGLDTLTWTNVAAPLTAQGAGSVSATIPLQFNIDNTLIYLLLEKATIFNLLPNSNGTYSNSSNHQVPPGLSAKVVVVSKINNKYYYSEKSFVTNGNHTIDFASVPELTLNQLYAKLEAL